MFDLGMSLLAEITIKVIGVTVFKLYYSMDHVDHITLSQSYKSSIRSVLSSCILQPSTIILLLACR